MGIDPGTFESAYVLFDGEKIYAKGKVKNEAIMQIILHNHGTDSSDT